MADYKSLQNELAFANSQLAFRQVVLERLTKENKKIKDDLPMYHFNLI